MGVNAFATLHIFQDQVRLAVLGYTGIRKPRDVRMFQPGQEASFPGKAQLIGAAYEGDIEQLDGDGSLEASITAVGQPDGSHSALAEHRVEGVRAHTLAGQGAGGYRGQQWPGFEKTLRIQQQAKLQKQWIEGLRKKTFIRYF